jgi:hypothetical protein
MQSSRIFFQSQKAELDVTDIDKELDEKIDSITRFASKPYYKKALKKLAKDYPGNASIICTYIMAEEAEINIKQSTKEGKIKVLIWLSSFHSGKSFNDMIAELYDKRSGFAHQGITTVRNSVTNEDYESATHILRLVLLVVLKLYNRGNGIVYREPRKDYPEKSLEEYIRRIKYWIVDPM